MNYHITSHNKLSKNGIILHRCAIINFFNTLSLVDFTIFSIHYNYCLIIFNLFVG